jgi:methylmalonyl-CoA mutase N-terminal domain/subunit
MPTLMGYDTDEHPQSARRVRQVRRARARRTRDMEIVLFDGIPLDKVTTSMTINSPAAVIWAHVHRGRREAGRARSKLGGTLQNDILKEFIAQKEYIFPPRAVDAPRHATPIEFCTNARCRSGTRSRSAATTSARPVRPRRRSWPSRWLTASSYVKLGVWRAAWMIDEFAPRLSASSSTSHNDFFEEIAKFRAGRRIWAQEMRERFGAKNPRSWMLRFHTQTAGVSLTAQQPLNNVVRDERCRPGRRPGRHPEPAHQQLRRGPTPCPPRRR